MTTKGILKELESLGSASYKRTMLKHGVREPVFGVKISELKKIQRRIKRDYKLALDLYATGNYDAMYLAGMIADDARMSRDDLQRWAEGARGGALAGATVPGVAAGNAEGWSLALEWIDSKEVHVACAGWSTLGAIVSVRPDNELDLPAIRGLIARVEKEIHQSPDHVRYHMNGFLIAVGCYVLPLKEAALSAARAIGPVTADLGDNQCSVPEVAAYIRKVEQRGVLGKKRKSAKC
jgi:hypothetical protein